MTAVSSTNPAHVPVEISRANQHDVRIRWQDGHVGVYPARFLRLRCACAECVHEMTGEALLKPATIPADVHPVRIEAVGRYAVQIYWSDGHSTGIYSFDLLRSICPCETCLPTAGA